MIEQIRLDNFRSFSSAEFSFGPLSVIMGMNGSGKTSILEAISLLSLTTSWKTEKDTEVIRFGQPFTRVVSGESELVIQDQPYLKRMRIDGISKRAHQVIGLFPTILFQPDDLALLYGAPTFRRQYLDRIISQTSPGYTQAVIELAKVLKQRNRLLKNIHEGISEEAELLFWDQELSNLRELMQTQRLAFIEELNARVPGVFQGMVAGGGNIIIRYHQSPHDHSHSFLQHLQQNHGKEIAAGSSLYGPHREDLEVFWGEHPVNHCMSRGQARSLLIAFKIAELEFVTNKSGRRPVLLLDDIFSELDLERRRRLFQIFGQYQVIMTTTEIDSVKEFMGSATIITLQ